MALVQAHGNQEMAMRATVLRLQRDYQLGAPLRKGEVIDAIGCAETCDQKPCPHEKRLGVYRLEPLGTIVGGNPLQKVASFLRIKRSNFNHGNRTH